jgi:hypothetical protein
MDGENQLFFKKCMQQKKQITKRQFIMNMQDLSPIEKNVSKKPYYHIQMCIFEGW